MFANGTFYIKVVLMRKYRNRTRFLVASHRKRIHEPFFLFDI